LNAFRQSPGPAAADDAAGTTDFDERSRLVQQLMADLEQAVGEVDAVLKDSIDSLRSDAPGKREARRELAQQIVDGAWMNRENPDWDPAEPATHRPITDDPLLAMLAQWSSQVDAAAAALHAGPPEAQSSTGRASSRSSPRARS
jgi:hypothetical protein